MRNPKVLVAGDYMTDIWHIGKVRCASPENYNVPIMDIRDTLEFPGGADNVVANLRSLGVDVVKVLRGLFSPEPIKNRLVNIDTGEQIARWDQYDKSKPLRPGSIKYAMYTWPHCYVDAINTDCDQGIDAIVVSDYNKGTIGEDFIKELQAYRDIYPIYIDTKRDPSIYVCPEATYFPNITEYLKYKSSYDKLENVVLTLGANGAKILPSISSYTPRIKSRSMVINKVISVAGAGDTVVAAYVYAHLTGLDKQSRLDFAMAAAGVVVEKPYTATVTLEEVNERLKEFNKHDSYYFSDYAGTQPVRCPAD